MNRQTAELTRAFVAIDRGTPQVVAALRDGTLPVDQQHTFAGHLIELGEMLHDHADDQASGIISSGAGVDPAERSDRHMSAVDSDDDPMPWTR